MLIFNKGDNFMVTKEEIAEFNITNTEKVKNAQRVTAAELSHFEDDNAALAEMIGERKKQYEIIISGEYEDYVKTESLKYKVLNFLKKG